MEPREHVSHRHSHLVIILLSVLVGGILTALVLAQTQRPPALVEPAAAQQTSLPAFEQVAEKVLPAVVYINSEMTPQADPQMRQQRKRMEEFYKQLPPNFRFQMPEGEEGEPHARPAAGSGWIYDADGYIVTNAHVVRGASKVTVQLHDKEGDDKEYPAKIIGVDPRSELAIIKVDAGRRLPTLQLGDSSKSRIGSWVMAVGSPFMLQQTVTVGVVSARGRVIDGESRYFRLGDLIQTDASINPGNSGGPLVNLNGDVVGINVAIASPGAVTVPFNVGIGFAIPADTAKLVLPQLRRDGKVARGWLGVTIKDLNDSLRQYFNVPDGGVLVTQINENAPASKVLQPNDVVLAVEGRPVRTTWDLQNSIANTAPGTKVKMQIVRGKKTLDVAVELGVMPAQMAGLDEEAKPGAEETYAGPPITVKNITPQLATEGKLTRDSGVVVTKVGQDLDDRLLEGDVILKVNDTEVTTVEQYKAAVDAALKAKAKFLVLTIERRDDAGKKMTDIVDVPLE